MSLLKKTIQNKNQMLRAPSSVGRRNLMRVDEGRNTDSSRDENEGACGCGEGGKGLLSGIRVTCITGRRKKKEKCEDIKREKQHD